MRILDSRYFGLNVSWIGFGWTTMRLRTKLLIALIPSVVLILVLTGYITHWFSKQFLNEAIERNVQVQTLAIAHELEIFLNQCKEDLLLLAQQHPRSSRLIRFLESRRKIRGLSYREAAYISLTGKDHAFIASSGNGLVAVAPQEIVHVRPNPLLMGEKVQALKANEIWVSDVLEATYPSSVNEQALSPKVLRLLTPVFGRPNELRGFLLLSVDVHQLREILSLFNSPRSPIFAYVRSPEVRFSYLFDRDGWVLFQSEGVDDQKKDLSTDMVRSGLSGTFGKPGLGASFRPHSEHAAYWDMVDEVAKGRHGLVKANEKGRHQASSTGEYFLGYAPIRLARAVDNHPEILFGIAFVDRSRLTLWAGYRQIDVMFVITLGGILMISLLIFGLSRVITRPTLKIASAVKEIQETGELREIALPDQDYETSLLKNAVNSMIGTLRQQIEEIRIRDEKIETERQSEKVRLEEEIHSLKRHLQSHEIEEIVGVGPVIQALKSDVLKAASVDVDVLIIGETGTGKQLVAEAIHKYSRRSQHSFISVNCGALDENLLMDSLFGHLKGAFTEAKAERKGAFLEAHGGTLFLDEIGTASPRVQQALLRAISMRKIQALGSDHEMDVDVRVITATNEDLRVLMEKGLFREDLYYRLEVLSVRTPALRDHRESIPILVDYFLRQARRLMSKEGLGLSRGALEKLTQYHWPGNVRELANCVTRAVAMTEGNLIQAQDVKLAGEVRAGGARKGVAETASRPMDSQTPLAGDWGVESSLNERQRKALPVISRQGRISRSGYQRAVGHNLPSRTALYDLQDLVKKGILRKAGRGPATFYYLAKSLDLAR